MGYSIYLTRDSPISLAEWKAVVDGRIDVRLQQEGASLTNPKTGEVIRFTLADGDAEVFMDGQWYPCFRWGDGQVSCGAPRDFEDPKSPFRVLLRTLAQQLSARVEGQEDEVYE